MVETLTTPMVAAWVTAALGLAGYVALARERPRLVEMTLVTVWYWSLISLSAILTVEMLAILAGTDPPTGWIMPARLLAATSTICPVMALLGAKRPQDRAWQFVVAALWPILCLPSLQWLLFGGMRDIHPAQLGFLAILVGTGLINGLTTRFWLASLLYGGGQLVLLVPFFAPTQGWLPISVAPLAGMALIVVSWWLLALEIPAARPVGSPLDRVWLDFRDAFGAVWGLRVMERMNASAAMYDWPVSLDWDGFSPRDPSAADLEVPPAVADSLRALLRRFVSPAWIDKRMASRQEPTSIR